MSCSCDFNESCGACCAGKIARLEKLVKEMDEAAENAMNEAHEMVGAKMLMSLRWIRKLAARALFTD